MFSPDFPGSPVVGSLPANAGDIGSVPDQGLNQCPLHWQAGDIGSVPGLGRFHMLWGSSACAP